MFAGLIPFLAMTIVSAWTVVLFLEPRFILTTRSMICTSTCQFLACGRINIRTAKLLATLPAPGATTAGPNPELAVAGQTTSKNIITRIVF
jgi:hypothetical protein